jgi:hypothetical protein
MSLGYGYDMVLLPPRHPTDGDHGLSQPGGALRRYHRSHRDRAARRRRAQCSHHHRLVGGDGVPRFGAPQPDAYTDFLAEDLCRMSLAEGKMPTRYPVTPPYSAAPPLAGSGSFALTPGTLSPWAFPYGLDTAARAYASSKSTSMSAYEELPRHHLRSTLDLVASTPASKYLDSMETPGMELRAIASRRYDPRDDHSDYVPNPRIYPLIVDPIIANTRLTKSAHGRWQQPQHHLHPGPRPSGSQEDTPPTQRQGLPWLCRENE